MFARRHRGPNPRPVTRTAARRSAQSAQFALGADRVSDRVVSPRLVTRDGGLRLFRLLHPEIEQLRPAAGARRRDRASEEETVLSLLEVGLRRHPVDPGLELLVIEVPRRLL